MAQAMWPEKHQASCRRQGGGLPGDLTEAEFKRLLVLISHADPNGPAAQNHARAPAPHPSPSSKWESEAMSLVEGRGTWREVVFTLLS
jgi:hypothetical protein